MCDIVYGNPSVSSLHAEIKVYDDMTMRIEDKNSTNGTFVNQKKLSPGGQENIRPGDLIQLADVRLNWNDVSPIINRLPSVKNYKEIHLIGKDNTNDVVISNDNTVSRFHGYLLKKRSDNKWYIRDNGSTNGTSINGRHIQKNTDTLYKKGDTVIMGSSDVSDQLQELAYPGCNYKWLKVALFSIAGIAVIAGILYFILPFKTKWNPEKAVVYVDASYHYQLKFDTKKLPIDKDVWQTVMGEKSEYGVLDVNAERPYSATAFFIDRNGHMATNRHVARPWENENSTRTDKELCNELWEQNIRYIPYVSPENIDEVASSGGLITNLLNMAKLQTIKYGHGDYHTMNSILAKLKNLTPEVTGVMDYICVGYPGRNYTHRDEYDRCYVVGVSDSEDKDVAILQLNTKKTPEDIKDVFSLDRIYTGKLTPVDMKMRWEGYPRGMGEALDQNTHSLEPQIRETTIGKVPSKYSFEIQGETGPGASGSPIYNPEKGEWYGIVWGGRGQTATYSLGCQAKYIKEVYDKEATE